LQIRQVLPDLKRSFALRMEREQAILEAEDSEKEPLTLFCPSRIIGLAALTFQDMILSLTIMEATFGCLNRMIRLWERRVFLVLSPSRHQLTICLAVGLVLTLTKSILPPLPAEQATPLHSVKVLLVTGVAVPVERTKIWRQGHREISVIILVFRKTA
jgi:hypothetical protein